MPSNNTKTVSLKVPESKPTKIYVKRAITGDQSQNLEKKLTSIIS